jgi:hypothetical protein
MDKLISGLRGKKTYIISVLLVLVSVVNYVSGDVGLKDLLNDPNLFILLNGLGLASLRAGVSNG